MEKRHNSRCFQKFRKKETLVDQWSALLTATKYIDLALQPHVKELRVYVKDSNNFIRKINDLERIPENSIFVTLDVSSLYINIPNNEGIKDVQTKLKRKNIATRIITTFLHLVLPLNNLIFNCQNYLQIKGCAMGTICAPNYANIFMGIFEEKFIYLLVKQHDKTIPAIY